MKKYRVLVNGFEVDCDWFTTEYVKAHTTKEIKFREV